MITHFYDIEATTLHQALRKAHWCQRQNMFEEFDKIGLTEGQPKILGFLTRNDGCIQRELAEHCHIKASTVTNILFSMEKAELIYRTPNPKDRRVLNVFLTEKGWDAHQRIKGKFAQVDEAAFEGFSEEERKQTIDYLNRIYDNLERRKREDEPTD